MKQLYYYLLSAGFVCYIAWLLAATHFSGYPKYYGWPAFWHSQTIDDVPYPARQELLSGEWWLEYESGIPIPNKKNSGLIRLPIPPMGGEVVRGLSGKTPLFILSHVMFGLSLCFVLYSTWYLLTSWAPKFCGKKRFSIRSMLGVMTVCAITLMVAQIRPSPVDFHRAKLLLQEQPMAFVGFDLTATWRPWYERGALTFAVMSSFLVIGRWVLFSVYNGFSWRLVSSSSPHEPHSPD